MVYSNFMTKPTSVRFNSYNTRRNLPPEIGRKRGEANFLCAFERFLLSSYFTTGFGGKHFSLSNYGIADFVWFIPSGDARNAELCASLYAFETKLENWRRAFQQAYRYSYYSDASFVVLPHDKSNRAIANLDLFKFHGIGLWLFDKRNSSIEQVFTPQKTAARNASAKQKAIKAISGKINFCKFPEQSNSLLYCGQVVGI
jgi:hypothetical protein